MSNLLDQISMAPNSEVAQDTFAVLDATQGRTPANQVLTAALATLLWCHRYGIDPRDVLANAANRFRVGLREQNTHIFAIKNYMRIEIDDPAAFNF